MLIAPNVDPVNRYMGLFPQTRSLLIWRNAFGVRSSA